MRLVDLSPKWVTGDRSHAPEAKGKRCYVGVTFKCPHCMTQRIGVLFDPPIDDGVLWLYATWEPMPGLRWTRTAGETFDTLTLSPSINAGSHGHWHGNIINGELRP